MFDRLSNPHLTLEGNFNRFGLNETEILIDSHSSPQPNPNQFSFFYPPSFECVYIVTFTFYHFPFYQVEVVLHCAATVRFDENLSAAISMNVSALKKPNQRIETMVNILYVRLGQLLPCLTSPVVCTSWRLLFTYRQHTPTVTGQHPRVARHSPMKHLGSKWHQWELNISGTTQMRRSIQLQLPQESRNYCSKFLNSWHNFFPIGLSPF